MEDIAKLSGGASLVKGVEPGLLVLIVHGFGYISGYAKRKTALKKYSQNSLKHQGYKGNNYY